MILSHKHEFIFIKTMKTAGTSIEMALSLHCGPDDVITPIHPENEAVRRRLGVFPQNYGFEQTDDRSAAATWPGKKRSSQFYNHMSAAEILQRVGKDLWNSYFKFCVERSPWERAISMYHWQNRNEHTKETLSEFLRTDQIHLLHERGWDLYTIDDEVVVDEILLYEKLENQLETVRKRIGLPAELDLPKAKSQYRRDRRPHYDVMTPEDMSLIGQIFRKEIDLLGYKSGP